MLNEKKQDDYLKGMTRDSSVRSQIDLTPEEKSWDMDYRKISPNIISTGKKYESLHKKASKRTSLENKTYHDLKQQVKIADDALSAFINAIKNQLSATTKATLVQEGWVKWDKRKEGEIQRISSNKIRGYLQTLEEKSAKKVILVRYLVFEKEVLILLATTDAVLVRSNLITRTVLRQQVMEYREKLTAKKAVRALAKNLYQQLIQPIKNDLKQTDADVIMLSLDDVLHYLPFTALHDGQRYLTEDYELVTYTGLLTTGTKSDTYSIAAMGVSEGIPNDKHRFSPLPHVPKELDNIVREHKDDQTGILKGKVWLNQSFTQQALENALAEKAYTVLHLASHFHMNTGHALDSYLLLGNGKTLSIAKVLEEDRTMNFNAVELLTLSACKTAISSERVEGGDIESFAAVAQENGAGAVLASLWAVNDRSTSILMQNFYHAWQQSKHITKSAALQQAQHHFIRQGNERPKADCPAVRVPGMPLCADLITYPQQSHPYHWASFVLMGNWL